MAGFAVFVVLQAAFLICGTYGQLDVPTEDLLSRIAAVEKLALKQQYQIQLQQQHNAEQDKQLNFLRSTVKNQESKLAAQTDIISELQETIQRQEVRLEELGQQCRRQQDESKQEQTQEQLGEDGETPTRRDTANRADETASRAGRIQSKRATEGPVAFLVRQQVYTADSHLGVNQNILFDTIASNMGNGYHKEHGLFIAPVPGIYIFSASLNSFANQQIEADIVKNGSLLSRIYASSLDGTRDQGSTTVVTQLAAGDEVWTRAHYPADANVWGDSFSSFMGCLIMPL